MNTHQRQIARPSKGRTRCDKVVAIRQATSADAVLLAGLLMQLSERALELRFMRTGHLRPEMLWQEALRMTEGQPPERTTLLATMQRDDRDETIAIAELVRYRNDATVGEIAFVVRDDVQRQGIGTLLLWRIVCEAQRLGITRLSASMMADNHAMLRLVRSLGLPYTARASYGEMEMRIAIPGHQAEPSPAQSAYAFVM